MIFLYNDIYFDDLILYFFKDIILIYINYFVYFFGNNCY